VLLSIGVSNFDAALLRRVVEHASVGPHLVQVLAAIRRSTL
jgi:diketogulonate reductase-like aldo/keto reductase